MSTPEVRAFQLEEPGVYVLLSDVVQTLRAVASQYEEDGNPSAALSLRLVADSWLTEEPQISEDPVEDLSSTIIPDRIEVFPDDPNSQRPRWHARTVDGTGKILKVTNGSFDQDSAIRDAQDRWPGLNVHMLVSAGQDTIWEETDPGGYRSAGSGRRRPSPNRIGLY